MGLPRRAGDAAQLRKVGAGDRRRGGRGGGVTAAPNRGLCARPQSLKPLLEKRRRARINQSLSQLQGLLLPLLGREVSARARGPGSTPRGARVEGRAWGARRGRGRVGRTLRGRPTAGHGAGPAAPADSAALSVAAGRPPSALPFSVLLPRAGAQNSRSSKLEKADILELTVRFLRELPASACPAAAPAPSDSYREGYRACLARLARVLPACCVLEPAVSARLLEHLRRRAAGATPDDGRPGNHGGPPSPAPPPAPAPAPSAPAPPRGPGLWRPW
uniref:Hes family bHLH transcription factor 2 n=1 Tax=Oryctolagus cuniculus TaxID=9986 RepID=A0A5F9DBC9_RABIT